MVNKYCSNNGRIAESPIRMFKYLLIKTVSIAIEKGIIRSKSIIVDATHSLSRSNPLSPIDVLKERARQLRKVVYCTNENWKDRMTKKNEYNDLERELLYCDKLEKEIESDEALRSMLKVKEKLNLLKETIEKCTWIRKSHFVRDCQYANAGCNSYFYFTVNLKRILKLMN